MDIKDAINIVKDLANGIDPTTGDAFPYNSAYNNPDVIRALYAVLDLAMKNTASHIARENDSSIPRKQTLPAKANKRWSVEDDELLTRMFKEGYSEPQMQEILQRTRGSIQVRLEILGLIEPKKHYWRRRKQD